MGRSTLDPSVWNLGVPMALLCACGPIVPLGGTDTDSADATAEGPTDDSSPSTTVSTSPSTTSPSTTAPGCIPGDCPPGYDCIDGVCQYTGYCADGYCCYDTCCGFECGWYYECFDNVDCAPGQACLYNQCQYVEPEAECESVDLTFLLPIPSFGDGVTALAFADLGPGPGQELVVSGVSTIGIADAGGGLQVIAAVPSVTDVAAGDIDNDGDLDIVYAGSDGGSTAHVLLNDGNGGGWAPVNLPTNAAGAQIELVDFGGDGTLDVVLFGEQDATYVMWNDGLGGFSSAEYVWDATVSLVPGDLDGSGLPDVALHSYETYAMQDGPFSAFELYTGVYPYKRALAVANFDGQGSEDLIGIESVNGVSLVTMWPGSLFVGNPWMFTSWPQPIDVVSAGDINQDGYADVVGGGENGVLMVGYGQPSPSPDLVVCVGQTNSAGAIRMIDVGEFSGDGRLDVAVSDGESAWVHLRSG
ncbi:MAG: VCBS repeat-containing protein [Deltaproteobacteria bacterium]|nr:VCBS repeat-containing protein [Deltaproteobacteria bacterium]MBP7285801.1 VCBS repeat-containing protein [Nannocystaceae bacterium]